MPTIPRHKRLAIYKRDKWRCRYCRIPVRYSCKAIGMDDYATLDHRMAKAQGGGSAYGNLVTACAKCNGAKAALSVGDAWDSGALPVWPGETLV